MSKPAKKRVPRDTTTKTLANTSPSTAKTISTNSVKDTDKKDTKQSHVVGMLQSPNGTTIAAVVKATGWQQHSVRGFFAGVVQKKLRFKLNSEKIGGNRTYRIVGPGSARSYTARLSNRRA